MCNFCELQRVGVAAMVMSGQEVNLAIFVNLTQTWLTASGSTPVRGTKDGSQCCLPPPSLSWRAEARIPWSSTHTHPQLRLFRRNRDCIGFGRQEPFPFPRVVPGGKGRVGTLESRLYPATGRKEERTGNSRFVHRDSELTQLLLRPRHGVVFRLRWRLESCWTASAART